MSEDLGTECQASAHPTQTFPLTGDLLTKVPLGPEPKFQVQGLGCRRLLLS